MKLRCALHLADLAGMASKLGANESKSSGSQAQAGSAAAQPRTVVYSSVDPGLAANSLALDSLGQHDRLQRHIPTDMLLGAMGMDMAGANLFGNGGFLAPLGRRRVQAMGSGVPAALQSKPIEAAWGPAASVSSHHSKAWPPLRAQQQAAAHHQRGRSVNEFKSAELSFRKAMAQLAGFAEKRHYLDAKVGGRDRGVP